VEGPCVDGVQVGQHVEYTSVVDLDPEELTQLELAQKVGDALNKAYPNHRKETL